jgi:hypothetical protein
LARISQDVSKRYCNPFARGEIGRLLQRVRFGRSLRSSRTPASPSPTDIRLTIRSPHSGGCCWRQLAFGSWTKFADGGAQRKGTRIVRHARCAARKRCIDSRTRGIRHDRPSSAYPRIRGEHRRQAKERIFLETKFFLGKFRKWSGRDRSLRSQRRLRDGRRSGGRNGPGGLPLRKR